MDSRLTKYNSVLKKYFGYDKLKDQQFEIIDKLVHEKKDVCAVLATGFGKSICYQLPFLLLEKCVIVVSPLLSLMEDQENKLKKLGIPVCSLNGNVKNKNEVINELYDECKIVFMTPEYLVKSKSVLVSLNYCKLISMVAIDEAHCISVWGNDFRNSYRELGKIREWLPDVVILSITATASLKVRTDICNELKLNEPHIVIGSFDRPNLYIEISKSNSNVLNDCYNILKEYPTDYKIIYCKTKKDTEATAEKMTNLGILSVAYHAGLDKDTRLEVQTNFIDGVYRCIVATVAFGMGIDVSNVRVVVHLGCPKNMESYYQEIGRAGRDGKKSRCYMFYSPKDFELNRMFIKEIKDRKEREYQMQQLVIMERFIHDQKCRRKVLLCNFGQTYDRDSCDNCDNCNGNKKYKKIDYTDDSYLVLSLINELNGRYGKTIYVNILKGSSAKNITGRHKKMAAYGKGKDKKSEYWKELLQYLIDENYLECRQVSGGFGSIVCCTKSSMEFLENRNSADDKGVKNKIIINTETHK